MNCNSDNSTNNSVMGNMWSTDGMVQNGISLPKNFNPSAVTNSSEHNMNSRNNNSNSWHTMNNHSGRVDVRSYQEMLFESMGKFVVCRFLMGTEQLVTATGILRNVGSDYFVLEDPCTNMMTTCDLYSVKFISVLPDDFIPNIPSYCRRRLYENAPIFTSGF